MEISWKGVSVARSPREKDPGLVIETYADAMQDKLRAEHDKKYPPVHTGKTYLGQELYAPPPGYSDSYDHFHNFFEAVRSRQPVVEDAVFGFRAAGAALLGNVSYERDTVVHWDPEAMKLL